MNKLPILQSGFITYNEENLVNAAIIKDPFTDIALNKDHLKSKNIFFYSELVTDLYKKWCANPAILKDTTIREQIIKAAKIHFSLIGARLNSIEKWIRLQNESPFLSQLHVQFLNETLIYVLFDLKRTIETPQWIRLLDGRNSVKNAEITTDKFFSNVNNDASFISKINLSDFLTEWLCRDKGFEDLLLSLYVIFGSRSFIIELSDTFDKYE